MKDSFREYFARQGKLKAKIMRIEELKGRRVNEEVHKCFMAEVDYLLEKYEIN